MEKEFFPEFVQQQFKMTYRNSGLSRSSSVNSIGDLSSNNNNNNNDDSQGSYGTFVARDIDAPSLSEIVPEIKDFSTEEWERNILALEKGF